MYWGQGSALGVLTFIGYLLSVFGAALVWRGRDEVSVWIQDELCAARRSFSRYTVVGPFYGPRPDSRLKAVPVSFVRSIRRMPRNAISGGMILAFLGPLLVLLDFLI
ncbi:MAG TPA: hypothetical protein VKQ28_18030 [Candidatus Acidoferrum sp.]|nr:hypothetical protein [Candidatus Acidoferrum sp.]